MVLIAYILKYVMFYYDINMNFLKIYSILYMDL